MLSELELQVQKDNFQIPTLYLVISRKSFATRILRKFKSLVCNFGSFVATKSASVEFQLQLRFSILKFGFFVGVNLFVEPGVHKLILLLDQQRQLAVHFYSSLPINLLILTVWLRPCFANHSGTSPLPMRILSKIASICMSIFFSLGRARGCPGALYFKQWL